MESRLQKLGKRFSSKKLLFMPTHDDALEAIIFMTLLSYRLFRYGTVF